MPVATRTASAKENVMSFVSVALSRSLLFLLVPRSLAPREK